MGQEHSGSSVPTQAAQETTYYPSITPLSVSSGNLQSLTRTTNDGIENQLPLPPPDLGTSFVSTVSAPFLPIPERKLGSNIDDRRHTLDPKLRRSHHISRRAKALLNSSRPYLQHPQYLGYISRQRQDRGDDGKPIWPEHVENAFQNALVHIPAMGRKKFSQGGKPHGRNMLIAEWIFRETGEKRKRKQVSSHIQVLDRFLKGIPEWDKLMKPPDEADDPAGEGHKFYYNSIEHMVNYQRALSEHTPASKTPDEPSFEHDNTSQRDADYLGSDGPQRLNFEMWVSLPNDREHVLHTYTRLQHQRLTSQPLEEIVDWRKLFPHMQNILDSGFRLEDGEVILLNVSFRLMDDFPPRHSKLGIGLELDFPSHSPEWPTEILGDKSWTSVTRIYHEGIPLAQPTHEDCAYTGRATVKPLFRSRWWASKFMEFTEARKVAEDSQEQGAIDRVDEQADTYLRSLTIIQEIFSTGVSESSCDHEPKHERRRAILLWTFSRAPQGTDGKATWQRLIPPSGRPSSKSLAVSGAGMELPPLTMDTIVDFPMEMCFGNGNQFLPNYAAHHDLFPANDEVLCQDGFSGFRPQPVPGFDSIEAPFHLESSRGFDHDHRYGEGYDAFNMASGAVHQAADKYTAPTRELLHHGSGLEQEPTISSTGTGCAESPSSKDQLRGYPLTRFNMRTHQVLQEQLGTTGTQQVVSSPSSSVKYGSTSPRLRAPEEETGTQQIDALLRLLSARQHDKRLEQSWNPGDALEEEEELRAALLAASASNNEGGQAQPSYETGDDAGIQVPCEHTEAQWDKPTLVRPTLQTHHSFPGFDPVGVHLDFHAHDGTDPIFAEVFAQDDNFSTLPSHTTYTRQHPMDDIGDDISNKADPYGAPHRIGTTRAMSEPEPCALAMPDGPLRTDAQYTKPSDSTMIHSGEDVGPRIQAELEIETSFVDMSMPDVDDWDLLRPETSDENQ